MQGGNEDGPEAKRKRGPYKRWLLDPNVPIPRSTIHSRELAAAGSSHLGQSSSSHSAESEVNEIQSELEADEVMSTFDDNEQFEADESDNAQFEADESDTETNKQTIDEQSKKQDKFIKKHLLDKPLNHQSKLSKLDVLVAILHMAVRHCHTQHFIEDQIKFVNFLFGDTVLDVSYYIFKTLFTPSVTITKHYFCLDCELYLGKDEDFKNLPRKLLCPECKTVSDDSSSDFIVCSDCSLCVGAVEDFTENQSVQCPKCEKNIDINSKVPEGAAVCCNCQFYMSSKKKVKKVNTCQCPKCKKQIDVNSVTSGNYFVTFSLREQIEEFLSKPGLKFVSRTERDANVIADICDGEFYRKLMEPGGPLENPNALTVTFNTDGVQVFESTHNDMYPIWYYINEVVPEQRFKQENLLLAGIWFSKSAPNMALFLEPFAEQLVNLSADGVSRSLPNGDRVKCPVYPLMCSVDAVCKAKVLCQKQFNGKCGCLYCYHPNDATVEALPRQKFYSQEKVYSLRTDDEVIRDMVKADKLQQEGLLKKDESVNGFLGISILLKFTALLQFLSCNTFGIVWGVAIDYLHAALEGVTSDLCNIIGNILTPDQLKILDKRMEKITPPQAMTRRPRVFSDRSDWKAKEFRAFLLYYSLPCLVGLLADRYYNNLKLFVNALHILLSDSISRAKLFEAATCLDKFCVGFQRLYGIVNVSYNLHICRHFPELVKRYGALWCYSNFVFESGNGYLLKFIRGTQSVVNEIATKYTAIKTASKLMSGKVSDEAVEFCSQILKSKYPKDNEEIGRSPEVSSPPSVGQVSENEANLLLGKNVSVSEGNTVKYFNRVIRDRILYCSKSYTKSNVHDDSCVMLSDGRFAVIDKFVKSSTEELLCIIKPIRIAQGMDIVPSIKQCSHDIFERSELILFSSVQRKCFMVTVEDNSFVCEIPNFYERD